MRHIRSLAVAATITLAAAAHAQSNATLSGTVKDPSGAVLPGAQVTIHNLGTGADRVLTTDSAGLYVAPSLQPGDYSVSVTASGFGTFTVQKITLPVDARITLDAPLNVASAGQTIQVEGAAPLIQSESITVGQVIDPVTVQEVPLNGRHFMDLTVLTPGSVTSPAAGNLSVPSRGLGANSFITAGNRDDSVNFQINGVNLNDMVQNQITFQPSINTTSEFKVNNQTFSAEYGRSSGSIVNVTTRSGTNQLHGEVFEYVRNEAVDARNYINAEYLGGVFQRKFAFKRHNFGAAVGGPIWKDHTFFFASYEALRQAQGVSFNTIVLSDAQRAAVTDASAQKLLALIPRANDPSGTTFTGSSASPVQIDQGTMDISHQLTSKNTLHGFYAMQKDKRTEPNLQSNTLPGFGDFRTASRQILTLNDTHVFSPRLVNEARLGFNRIGITFAPAFLGDPTAYGLSVGQSGPVGIPQISITGTNINIGGPQGFPQGRTDTLGIFSDAATLVSGAHSIKFGGEFRRFLNVNFTQDTGAIAFTSIANFQAGQVTTFSITPGILANRFYQNAVGAFVQDNWKVTPQLNVELGLRYEWNGSPLDGGDRLSVFDLPSLSLTRVNTNGLGHSPYQQNHNIEPRLGASYDVFGNGRTVVRAAYGYMADQPETNAISNLNRNAPFSRSASYTSGPTIPLNNLYALATTAGGSTVSAIQRNFRNAYTQTWNANLQQSLVWGMVGSVGYYGAKGTHLRQVVNLNQFAVPGDSTSRPLKNLSNNSPLTPNASINANINQVSSVGWSNYNAMWLTLQKQVAEGLTFSFNYNYSRSLDTGSQPTSTFQDNTRLYLNYGPSDFDTTNRVAFNVVYRLPLKGSRLVEGWQISGITQWQSGNPLNIVTNNNTFGSTGVAHPNYVRSVPYQKTRLTQTTVRWFDGTTCSASSVTAGCVFQVPSANTLGTMTRNALRGPGFADTDVSLEKNTKITEGVRLQVRVDAFDVFNHPNFGNPGTTAVPGSGTFGVITGTRFLVGDAGSSRQLQAVAKIIF